MSTNIGKWRTRKGLPILVGGGFAALFGGVTTLLLFGMAGPEDMHGNFLPFSLGVWELWAWMKSPVSKGDWQAALVTLNAYHLTSAVVVRCQAVLVAAFLGAAAGFTGMLPFADEYRVGMRLDRGLLLVRKLYPAQRAARKAFQDHIEPKYRKLNLYLELAPGVPIPFDQEVLGFLTLGSPGSGKTVWFQYILNQIMARSNHLAEMTKTVPLADMPIHPDKAIVVDIKGDFTGKWPNEDFILFAPHDTGIRLGKDGKPRQIGYAWDIGKDIVGLPAARDFAAAMIPLGEKEPKWDRGARNILTAIIRGLQYEHDTNWGWHDLAAALNKPAHEQKEYLEKIDPKAAAYYTFDKEGGLTSYSASYVGIINSNVGPMIDDLASGWGQCGAKHRISITEWLLTPVPKKRFIVLQMSGQVQQTSEAWVRAVIGRLASFTKSPELPESSKRRVWLVCDEAPQYFKKGDGFLQTIEVGRSKGFCAIVAAQVNAQFDSVWSESEYKTLEAMVGTKLIYRTGSGVVTKHMAEDVIGSSDWVKTNSSRSSGRDGGSSSISREFVRELVVLPNWFSANLRKIKNKGMEVAWIGPKHLCRLMIPFQRNWFENKRTQTIPADWVKSNTAPPQQQSRPKAKGSGSGSGGVGSGSDYSTASADVGGHHQANPQAGKASPSRAAPDMSATKPGQTGMLNHEEARRLAGAAATRSFDTLGGIDPTS